MTSIKADGGDVKSDPNSGDIAIFYPPEIDKTTLPPSFAIIDELEETDPPASWKVVPQFYSQGTHNVASIELEEDTSLYGTGQVIGPLLRNGRNTVLWNIGNFCYEHFEGRNLYQSHPWVLGVRRDGSAFGVIFDTSWFSEINLSEGIRFTTDGPPFRVIVIDRDSPQAVLRGLGELTGTMPLPPKWALGFQQCRMDYKSDSRLKEIADEYRRRKLPCDVIWADIHFMDGFRVFTFDPVGFPDPQATNDYLHERGFKSVWTSDPGIKAEPGYWIYDQGTERDFWINTASGKEYHGDVWPGPCAFPDFTRPEVRGWWAGLVQDFVSSGIDGVWIDMNEPDIVPFTTMPADNRHVGGEGLPEGPHAQYHNVYGMLVAQAIREGLMNARPDKRPFVLTRSNFLGGQRYAAMWTGDNASTWPHLRMSIPMSLNIGLAGQPFSGADIGGFWGNATPELFAHWIALGTFYPFSRAHTAEGTDAHEPWVFGVEVEAVAKVALERRYRLLPYLYTLFREASIYGIPVMRPLFFTDPSDPDLRNEDQVFLLGADLLVVPKWAENPQLPKGIWRSISLVGEDSVNDPYQPNLLMRGGSIIPLGKVVQNTTEESLDPLTLLVCLDGNGRAEGTLYEDAGEGYEYQQGEFLLTTYAAVKKGDDFVVTITYEEGDMKRPERETRIQIATDAGIIEVRPMT